MLTDEHRRMLEVDSAIKPEVIEARGYRSVKASDEALKAWAPGQRQDGLLIPSYNVNGDKLNGQLRPDSPRQVDGAPLKYESPKGGALYVDVHPSVRERVRHSNDTLVITEGVKKADCLVSHGVLCVALLGVWSWKGKLEGVGSAALPDWDAIPLVGRRVCIAFDSDVMTKAPVKQAISRLSKYLKFKQAEVTILDWKKLQGEGD